MGVSSKKCNKCFETKPYSEFYKNKQMKTGLHNECKTCIKKRAAKWAEDNPKKRKAYLKKYLSDNYEDIRVKRKGYLEKWNRDNKEYYRLKQAEYLKDPFARFKKNLRGRTNCAFNAKSWRKGMGTEKLIGGDYLTARNHISNQFSDGMTWDNYGEWHIDHILPLNSANTKQEMIELCHFKNLQPLWAFDNLSKGSKIT